MKFRLPALLIAAAAIVLAAALSACSSTTKPAPGSSSNSNSTIPQLTVGTNFSMSTLDPTKGGYASWAYQLSLETLLKFGPNTTLEPNLATSWAQTGPVTYVYHLRPGVKFWDGTELTAADVVYTWNYYRSPGSLQALSFSSVKSVRASGRYTVVVTLTHQDASWQYDPAQSAGIFEMRFAQAHKSAFGKPGTLIMGTGPWRVDSFDPTTGAELSANPHWWGGTVPIRHITIKLFANETSLELAMRAHEIDLDPYILDTKSFAAASGAKILSSPSPSLGVFSMNTKAGPWSDIHVRRAVAYALNRPDIISAAASTLTAWQATMTGPVASRPAEFSTGWGSGPDISGYGFSLGSWNAKPGEWNTADYTPPTVDGLLNAGIASSNPAKRFAVYSQLIRRLQADLPYVGLYLENTSIALSDKFTVPGFAQHYWAFNSNAYGLFVKPTA